MGVEGKKLTAVGRRQAGIAIDWGVGRRGSLLIC